MIWNIDALVTMWYDGLNILSADIPTNLFNVFIIIYSQYFSNLKH